MFFKKLSIEDKSVFKSYLEGLSYDHCDYSFDDSFCWQHLWQMYWCVEKGFLILKNVSEIYDTVEYVQPIGNGDFSPLIPLLEADAQAHGKPLALIDMTPEGVDCVRNSFPGFGFAPDRTYANYLYRADDLRLLSGKHYQAKRNHIHKFTSEYDYCYVELTPELFDDCLALETDWQHVKTIKGEGISEGELKEELSDEQKMIRQAFDNWNELSLTGGAIYVGDKMVAFTFGSPINDHVFCVHIEKADISYDGAFTVINQQFVEHLPRQYTLINREDDAGLPGLRKSKLSYHPVKFAEKITGRRLTDTELQVRALWMECFPEDSLDFIDTFLLRKFDPNRMLSTQVDGKIVSMLHIVPFGDTAYIYGVATAKPYRSRGMAGGLCLEAIERCRREGFSKVALIPSSDTLRKWYSAMGFEGDEPMTFIDDDGFDYGTGEATADRAMLYQLS